MPYWFQPQIYIMDCYNAETNSWDFKGIRPNKDWFRWLEINLIALGLIYKDWPQALI